MSNLFPDFDSETEKSKKEAEEALKTIDKIDDIIRETQNKNYDAQRSLIDAFENADLALKNAAQADTLAKNTSENLEKIHKKAEKLNTNSSTLIGEVETMEGRVHDTEERLVRLLRSSGVNDTLINEAKDKVGSANIGTGKVSKTVAELLEGVNTIVAELQTAESQDIDPNEIQRLEEEIQLAEEKIKEAKLEENLAKLQEEDLSQKNLIAQYKIDISRLEKEVENIQQIVAALPDGCFKRVELEP